MNSTRLLNCFLGIIAHIPVILAYPQWGLLQIISWIFFCRFTPVPHSISSTTHKSAFLRYLKSTPALFYYEHEPDDRCGFCFGIGNEIDQPIKLPCDHLFCRPCALTLFDRESADNHCPYCRKELYSTAEEQRVEKDVSAANEQWAKEMLMCFFYCQMLGYALVMLPCQYIEAESTGDDLIHAAGLIVVVSASAVFWVTSDLFGLLGRARHWGGLVEFYETLINTVELFLGLMLHDICVVIWSALGFYWWGWDWVCRPVQEMLMW